MLSLFVKKIRKTFFKQKYHKPHLIGEFVQLSFLPILDQVLQIPFLEDQEGEYVYPRKNADKNCAQKKED